MQAVATFRTGNNTSGRWQLLVGEWIPASAEDLKKKKDKIKKKSNIYLYMNKSVSQSAAVFRFSHFSAAAKFSRHFGNDQQVAVVQSIREEQITSRRFPELLFPHFHLKFWLCLYFLLVSVSSLCNVCFFFIKHKEPSIRYRWWYESEGCAPWVTTIPLYSSYFLPLADWSPALMWN